MASAVAPNASFKLPTAEEAFNKSLSDSDARTESGRILRANKYASAIVACVNSKENDLAVKIYRSSLTERVWSNFSDYNFDTFIMPTMKKLTTLLNPIMLPSNLS